LFNGAITFSSLNRGSVIASRVTNGYVEAFHPSRAALRVQTLDEYLPEVVVVGYYSSDGFSFSDWLSLEGMFSGGGTSSGYYSSLDYPYGGGGGESHSSSEQVYEEVPQLIDFEEGVNESAINVENYLKCFSTVPDNGATCSIEILADIPIDGNPNEFFDWQNGSPGHTFLQLKKSNGDQNIMQNIGFYPVSGWKTFLTSTSLEGKFVDNGGHEFNASLTMNISPQQLQSAITEILYLSRFVRYDIDEYNCTDFALEVFNYVRSPASAIDIPKYDIPGGTSPTGTSTPEGLYQKLQSMKKAAGAEAANIELPGGKSWAAGSKGPCN